MIYIMAGSLGFVTTSLILLISTIESSKTFKPYSSIQRNKRLQKLKTFLKSEQQVSKKEILISCIIGILFMGLSNGIIRAPLFFVAGFTVGLIILSVLNNLKKEVDRGAKLREISTLFEAIELYVKANYSLVQALRSASILTPGIKPYIDKCLDVWPTNPRLALEGLRKDLDVPEAEILISLLIHMEKLGTKDMEGILGREAYNIERLRKMKTEIKIANRPLLLMFYRILPLFSVLGIIIGSLLYRALSVMTDAGILNIWKG